ncbi:MAG: hypothetical protein WB681_08430 [Candidatus Cybelea sp.]
MMLGLSIQPAIVITQVPADAIVVSVPTRLKTLRYVPEILVIDFVAPKPPVHDVVGELFVSDAASGERGHIGHVFLSADYLSGPVFRAYVKADPDGLRILVSAQRPTLSFANAPGFSATRAALIDAY